MSNLNLSLDNPYGSVTIPRAKLSSVEDGSVVIANPAAVYSAAGPSALNPYGNFQPRGEQGPQDPSGRTPMPYEGTASTYTIKETEEKDSCCYSCWCFCCRRRKKK